MNPDERVTREPQRSLSMLRSYTPADALTIANASCGTIATFLCLDYMAFDNQRRIVDRHHAAAARLGVRHPRRLCGATEPETPVDAGRRSRFARRRHFVWPWSGRAGLYARPARWLGHGVSDVLRGLRREPARAVQRDRVTVRDECYREGQSFRRHARFRRASSSSRSWRSCYGAAAFNRTCGSGWCASGRCFCIHWCSSMS